MEVFEEHHRREQIELQGVEGFVVVDLAWGLFRVEHAGETDAEAEVVVVVFGVGVVAGLAVACQIGYAGFGEEVARLDVETGRGVVVQV